MIIMNMNKTPPHSSGLVATEQEGKKGFYSLLFVCWSLMTDNGRLIGVKLTPAEQYDVL